ncbi:hypothetical protein [Halosimplex sp. TS25]|uniref:hypothetical protein n=1 Tax=Halosimplex rarum TaxID=3396619 RepID=UPI0039ECE1E2
MGRTIELSGDRFSLLLYAVQLVGLLLVALFVAPRLGGPAGVLFGLLFASLVVATGIGLWRRRTGDDGGTHLETAEDITYDPIADPGQAARDRWETAVDRLPGGDGDGD